MVEYNVYCTSCKSTIDTLAHGTSRALMRLTTNVCIRLRKIPTNTNTSCRVQISMLRCFKMAKTNCLHNCPVRNTSLTHHQRQAYSGPTSEDTTECYGFSCILKGLICFYFLYFLFLFLCCRTVVEGIPCLSALSSETPFKTFLLISSLHSPGPLI